MRLTRREIIIYMLNYYVQVQHVILSSIRFTSERDNQVFISREVKQAIVSLNLLFNCVPATET